MKRVRLRFSLKMLFAAVAIVAAASYALTLPTFRAQQFVRFIDGGELGAAEEMLPASMNETSHHRHTIQRALGAALETLTLEQLLRGQRRVIVTEELYAFEDGSKSDQSETAQYIVWRTTISEGWHSFYQW